jgi:hypothetical protein
MKTLITVLVMIMIGSLAFAKDIGNGPQQTFSTGIEVDVNDTNYFSFDAELSPQFQIGKKSYLEFAFGYDAYVLREQRDTYYGEIWYVQDSQYYGAINLYIDYINIKAKLGNDEATVRVGVGF